MQPAAFETTVVKEQFFAPKQVLTMQDAIWVVSQ